MAKSKKAILLEELKAAHPEATVEELFDLLVDKTLEANQLAADKEEADNDVVILNEKLKDFESGKIKVTNPTVKVDKVEYTIKSPKINVKGEEFSAADIKENKRTVTVAGEEVKILDYLIKIKSGILVPKL